MSKRSAPKATPTPVKSEVKPKTSASQKAVFFGAALDMSWQLAVVVLVPIVGGFELDRHLHTSPFLTILGFVLAMLGTFVVMRRMLIQYSQTGIKPKEQK